MQKLSNEQQKLIVDNYDKVLEILKKHFNKKKYKNFVMENKSTSLLQCISYIVEAAASWDSTKSKDGNFTKFAVHRCIRRFIDELRKHSENYRIYAYNKKHNKKKENYSLLHGLGNKFVGSFEKSSNQENYFNDIDNKDFYECVLNKSEQFFKNEYKDDLHKKIIKEYIIPRISDRKVSLGEVANKLGIKKYKAFNILTSKTMKKFFNSIRKEYDTTG